MPLVAVPIQSSSELSDGGGLSADDSGNYGRIRGRWMMMRWGGGKYNFQDKGSR